MRSRVRWLVPMAVAATMVVGLHAALAVSTPLPLEFTSGGVLWGDLNEDDGFANDYDACDLATFTMSDARLLATDQADAFDGAGGVVVNDTLAYEAPPGTANAPVDLTGTVLTAPPAMVGPLQVSVEYHGMTSLPTMRELVTLTNPGTDPVTTDVALETNRGSDNATTLQAASTGDTTSYPTNARWFVTDDSDGGIDPVGDPPVVSVPTGPGAVQTPAVVEDCTNNTAAAAHDAAKSDATDATATPDPEAATPDPAVAAPAPTDEVAAAGLLDTDFFIYHYNVSIPAGATRYIMVFHSLYATTAEAVAAGPAWNTNPSSTSELLAGLPSLLDIVNWTFPVTLDFAG